MIRLIPFGEINSLSLEYLIDPLFNTFNRKVEISAAHKLSPQAWNPQRQQYASDSILDLIPGPETGVTNLGILDVDIFAFDLNFIFGEADAASQIALISLHRLKPEFYERPPDENLLRKRALTEAVHEIGHTYRLKHCPNIHCVMHFSNTIEDSDIKGWEFCPVCRRKMSHKYKIIKP